MVREYDETSAKRYVLCTLDMQWDQPFADRMSEVFARLGVTQEQYDVLVREYSFHVCTLFNPRMYSWWDRVKLAAHFLNPFGS